ncbi:MAG TPA: choice-of-anchor Q domain-containing protein [Phototrophicaceae bacterium]|nr:choice-of-anchor Q domain-containing protein [Phototrophicaceae bacterium]
MLRRIFLPGLILILFSTLAFSLLTPQVAHAANFNVGCNADLTTRVNDLITAINSANSISTDDTITLTAGCTYTLNAVDNTTIGNNGLPAIVDASADGTLTINGNGATITRSTAGGTPQFRFFYVNIGANLTLDSLTLSNGDVGGNNGGAISSRGILTVTNSTISGNSALNGGGIGANNGSILTVTNVTFSSNTATTAGEGGAIFNAGTATISSSTFTANTAVGNGGGIHTQAPLTVINSTFSGNSSPATGGGIYATGSTLTVTNSTFSGNSAPTNGSGIYKSSGTLNLNNSIVANSLSSNDCFNNAGGTLNVNYSLIQDGSCGIGTGPTYVNGNLSGDPLLGSLANNGGPTQTIALQTTSPAINAASDALAVDQNSNRLDFDQRGTGFPRKVGIHVDMGAFETQEPFKLVFNQQPTDTTASTNITPAVSVAVEDTSSAVVTTDNTTQVTLTIGNNPSGGTLSGTLTATVINGVATFGNLSIDKAGTGYTLVASSNPALTGATSNAFNIMSGATTTPTPTSTTPVSASNPGPTAIPAFFFECSNLGAQTTAAMLSDGGIGTVHSGDVTGDIYCHAIAQDGVYLTSSAEVGMESVINLGVEQAVDVFGELPGGISVVPFDRPIQVCLRGTGEVLFLNAATAERTVERLGATQQGAYLCVMISNAGTLVLVGNTSGLPVQPAAPTAATTLPASTPLTDCRVTTTNAPLNLRAMPDTNAAIVGQLPYNITLTATQYIPGWYNVIYLNGQGWVTATYLSFAGNCGQ